MEQSAPVQLDKQQQQQKWILVLSKIGCGVGDELCAAGTSLQDAYSHNAQTFMVC